LCQKMARSYDKGTIGFEKIGPFFSTIYWLRS
jgi:hypothetical protein